MDFKEQEEKEKSLRPSAAALGRNDFFDGRGKPIDIYVSLFYDIHL